jgi:superfamily II DNA or RNA helicase
VASVLLEAHVWELIPSTQVLEIHGIRSLQLHGKTGSAARARIVHQFKTSGADGIHVLVLSNVGQTGLNLPCANVMMIVVSAFPPHHV